MSRFCNDVKISILDEAGSIPTKAHEGDAGFDLYAAHNVLLGPSCRDIVHTGIALDMPEHLTGLIWPRSGLAVKQGIDVLAGVIDSGYRGEVMVCLLNTSGNDVITIDKGDRIAQLIFQEVLDVKLTLSGTLSASQRGGNGFGSSGN